MPRTKVGRSGVPEYPLATAIVVRGAKVLQLTCPVCGGGITAAERAVRMHLTKHFKKGLISDPQRAEYVRDLTKESQALWSEEDRRFSAVKMKEAFGESPKSKQ